MIADNTRPAADPPLAEAALPSRTHLSYLPHSGSVLTTLEPDLAGYDHTKGSLRFPIDESLPPSLVNNLVTARLAELSLHP